MMGDEARRAVDTDIALLKNDMMHTARRVNELKEGQVSVIDKLNEMHDLLHDQCTTCPPAKTTLDHEGRIRDVENSVTTIRARAGLVGGTVSAIVTALALAGKWIISE